MASVSGAPDRLFTIEEETRSAKIVSSPERYEEYARSFGQRKYELRNQIVLSRLYAIDMLYSDYEARLTRERQEVGFYSNIVNIALNSAGTLVGGAATKAALHAVAAGLVGAKTSYETDILIERTVTILQKQMRANRKEIKAQIVERLSGSTGSYPLEFALTDVERYYRAGTISGALLGVDADVSLKLDEAERQEERTIMRAVRAAPARAVNRIGRPRRAQEPLQGGFDREAKVTKTIAPKLQAALCAPKDGVFGPMTTEAIKIYQESENLPATGTLNSATDTDQIINLGDCDGALRNFSERKFFDNNASNATRLQILRNALAAKAQDADLKKSIEESTSLESLRPLIAKLRAEFGGTFIKTGLLQHQNTELTPKFTEKVFQ